VSLSGKRIVVTGASRGIGRAVARACAEAGAVVGVGYLASEDAATQLVAEAPERYRLMRCDVRDAAALEAAIENFAESEGGLEGVVSSAGLNHPGLLAVASPEHLEAMVAVNLLGPLYTARAALPHFLRARGGVIVNLSSVAATRPSRGQAGYAATKGGVEALTRSLAVEYGRKGIRAHCVRPGPVDTDMLSNTRDMAEKEILGRTPLRRIAAPEEVARLVLFLLSDEASFMTGGVVPIDGGYGAA
jgi:3-oxoacyl-[acyl-carrier protein] reductase